MKEDADNVENRESETDSFYERSFETIENYVDADVDDAFRDSAIFSDIEEVLVAKPLCNQNKEEYVRVKSKIAPPVPAKKRTDLSLVNSQAFSATAKCKPSVAQKPEYLKVKSTFRMQESDYRVSLKLPVPESTTCQYPKNSAHYNCMENGSEERDDVSAGQSQAGWVRKIVGQLQGHVET